MYTYFIPDIVNREKEVLSSDVSANKNHCLAM